MQGYRMDPEGRMSIRTEMAKANSKPKRARDFYPTAQVRRVVWIVV